MWRWFDSIIPDKTMRINTKYFLIGATLGLITLTYQNRDLLPSVDINSYWKNTPVYNALQPTKQAQQTIYDVCMAEELDSAYCICSSNTVEELVTQDEKNDLGAEFLYNTLQSELEVLCMKGS